MVPEEEPKRAAGARLEAKIKPDSVESSRVESSRM